MKTTKKMSFEEACARYVNRFTMEHMPNWARRSQNGKFYAPQYRSDREWYENTAFPPHNPLGLRIKDCYTTSQTWPMGLWLDEPYVTKNY